MKPEAFSSDDDRHICTTNDAKSEAFSSDDDRHTCTTNDAKSEVCSNADKGHATINAHLRSDKDKEITKYDKKGKRSRNASNKKPVNETSPSSNAKGKIVLSNLDVPLGRGKRGLETTDLHTMQYGFFYSFLVWIYDRNGRRRRW